MGYLQIIHMILRFSIINHPFLGYPHTPPDEETSSSAWQLAAAPSADVMPGTTSHGTWWSSISWRQKRYEKRMVIDDWLVVSTPLKNFSQWEGLFPYIMEK